MALYGQLYLQNGNWNGQQLIPESWIEASTTAYSITNPTYGIGYGMLWNVLMPTENRTAKSFYHTGAGVHMLGVYPASRLVLVHRVNTEQEYNFTEAQFYRMISLVWRAYTD
jgi:CubicO group peptidase (beta-lactamase class C family)